MNSGAGPDSPILVSAFRSALMHQWLIGIQLGRVFHALLPG
jgi:hypothetical protein